MHRRTAMSDVCKIVPYWKRIQIVFFRSETIFGHQSVFETYFSVLEPYSNHTFSVLKTYLEIQHFPAVSLNRIFSVLKPYSGNLRATSSWDASLQNGDAGGDAEGPPVAGEHIAEDANQAPLHNVCVHTCVSHPSMQPNNLRAL